MNPWIPVGITALIQLLLGAYVYGKLSNQVENHGAAILKLEKSDDQQWKEIGDLGQNVARLDGKMSKGAAAGD